MFHRKAENLVEKVSSAYLSEGIGFYSSQNLAGQISRIIEIAKVKEKIKYSAYEKIERIQYVIDRLQDETSKTKDELETNIGFYIPQILDYAEWFGNVKDLKNDSSRIGNFYKTEEACIAAAEDESPVLRVRNVILQQAVKDKADKIEIGVNNKRGVSVRYIINNILHEVMNLPRYSMHHLYDSFKLLAGINPAVCRKDACGKANIRCEGKEYEIDVKHFGASRKISIGLKFIKDLKSKREKEEGKKGLELDEEL